MNQWHEILTKCLNEGTLRDDRTGVGTVALFGEILKFKGVDLAFPAVTTKKLAFGQVAAELACFLHGYSNLAEFNEMGCYIWDANASAPYWQPLVKGDLGRIYGVQWRSWDNGIDQIKALVQGLRTQPHGRRHLVTMWNPSDLDDVCLPPCHYAFQCFVEGQNLDMMVVMRSVDLFLGLPFDIASYGLLLQLIAKELGLIARDLTFALGDAHIYLNHFEQVQTVLQRAPKRLPWCLIEPEATLDNFHPSMAKLVHYEYWDAVPAPMAV